MTTTILKLIGVTDAGLLGNLSPAYNVVQKMAETYQHLKLGQKRWKVVIQRAALIIKELREHPSWISAPGIQELQRKLEAVQDILETFSEMSFVKALLRHEDVKDGIDQANSLLDECQQLLQIDLSRLMQSQRNAEVADQDALRALLKHIVGNYEEIRRRFNIQNPEEEDQAMAALEREVKNAKITLGSTPLELQIMQSSLDCIRTTTGRRAPKQNKWLITEFDLDFCGTIGGGGFSTVSKARYKGTMVAVKKLKDIGNMREALEREIEIWSELRHDHIVPFYGASTLTSAPYIVSRYMQNGNLVQYLVANLNADRAKLILQVSLGMYYLHEKSIVHGDLKGVNVLVDDAGKACITDFGLSKVSSGKPGGKTGTVAGTLRYLAPEALKGNPLSFESDVYAFGMVIYEVFTGEGPFIRESDELVWGGHVELRRPTMSQADERGFNDTLWQLLSKCISREPSERPRFKAIQEQLGSIKKAELSAQSFVADPALGNEDNPDTDWGFGLPSPISQSLPPLPLSQPSSASRSTVPPPPTTTSAPVFPGSFSSHTMHHNPDDHDRHSLHHSNTVYSSPTLVNSSRSTIHPIRKAETLPPMELLSISEPSKPKPPIWTPILPMCIVVTHKYFGARFGVSLREPGVHLEEANAIRWQPITAKKGTLLYNEPNRFWYKSGTGTEQNLWELSGNDVTLRTGSTIGVCHFGDPQTAQSWFTLQLNHTRNGSVNGLAAIGDWFYTERSWRRLQLGKVQHANLVGGALKIVPSENSWSDVGLPKRCVLASNAGHDNCVVCITNAGGQTVTFTCKLEARKIVFETYHAERGLIRATEETYPTEEYAAMTFRALRNSIERASGR